MNRTNSTNLIAAKDSLSPAIKEWAGSLHTSLQIGEINERLGIETNAIAKLLFLLIVQELDPLDFINELSYELGVSFQTAKSIAGDIEEKILRPIEAELKKNVGVDSKLIYFGQPGPRKSKPAIDKIVKAETLEAPTATKAATAIPTPNKKIEEEPLIITGEKLNTPSKTAIPSTHTTQFADAIKAAPDPTNFPNMPMTSINIKNFEFLNKYSNSSNPQSLPISQTPPAPTSPALKTSSDEESPVAPFVIHEEDPLKTIKPIYTKENPFLNINLDKYYSDEKKATVKPTSIKLESDRPTLTEGQSKLKVINYSTFKTAINEAGGEKKSPPQKEDLINLETFTKIKGNEIDLRQDKK